MSKLSIELWAERGVPYPEIRHRLKERNDEECATATAMLLKLGVLDLKLGRGHCHHGR